MWTEQVRSMIGTGILETLYMTVVSTVFGYLFGLPISPLLYMTVDFNMVFGYLFDCRWGNSFLCI